MNKLLTQLFILSANLLVQLTSAEQTFNRKLYRAIAREKSDDNFLISPLSIEIALGLLYLGAEKQSAIELRNALQLPRLSKILTAIDYGDLISDLTKLNNNRNVMLRIANRVFVREDLKLKPNFKRLSTQYFKSVPENIDFTEATEAVKRINTWVEQQTANKIHNILGPRDVDEDTTVVLVNAIYFNANWAKQFEKLATYKQQFYVSEREQISADFMHRTEKFNYAEFDDLDAKVLEMKYVSTNLSMIIILPNEIDDLASLENQIETISFKKIINNLKPTYLDISVPKFRIEYEVNLQNPLGKTGIQDIFTKKSDLSGLVVADEQVVVSAILHKAFINVDEYGTEAAAATGIITTVPLSSISPGPKHFDANHPFLFAITNNKEILFAGHVVRPSVEEIK